MRSITYLSTVPVQKLHEINYTNIISQETATIWPGEIVALKILHCASNAVIYLSPTKIRICKNVDLWIQFVNTSNDDLYVYPGESIKMLLEKRTVEYYGVML